MAESTDIGVHLMLSAELIGDATPESFADSVKSLIAAAPVASAEFVPPSVTHETLTADLWWRPFLRAMAPVVQDQGTAFMVRIPNLDRAWIETSRAAGMDGVLVTKSTDVRKARDAVGADAIVGSLTGPVAGPNASARHDAMVAAENGADVVLFTIGSPAHPSAPGSADAGVSSGRDAAEEDGWSVVQWWGEMMEVPCIAVIPPTLADCRTARSSGADFVGFDRRLWFPQPARSETVESETPRWPEAADRLIELQAILTGKH